MNDCCTNRNTGEAQPNDGTETTEVNNYHYNRIVQFIPNSLLGESKNLNSKTFSNVKINKDNKFNINDFDSLPSIIITLTRDKESFPKKPRNLLLKEMDFDSEKIFKLTKFQERERKRIFSGFYCDEMNLDKVVFSGFCKFSVYGFEHFLSWQLERRPDLGIEDHEILGKGVLLWGFISSDGKFVLHRVRDEITIGKYADILENSAIPFLKQNYQDNFIFQQANGIIERDSMIRAVFKKNRLTVFRWPPNSQDLNPLQEVWQMLAAGIYYGRKVYRTKEELWSKIQLLLQIINVKEKRSIHYFYCKTRDKINLVVRNSGKRL